MVRRAFVPCPRRMTVLRKCPKCGHPGGLINCPVCHGNPNEKEQG